MTNNTSAIVLRLMTHVHLMHSVEQVCIMQDVVRIRLSGIMYDVRTNGHTFLVHELEDSCMSTTKAARDLEAKLNGEREAVPVHGLKIQPHWPPIIDKYTQSMSPHYIQEYTEHCGGPDLDALKTKKIWVRSHLLEFWRANGLNNFLDHVLFIEGRIRRDELFKEIQKHC